MRFLATLLFLIVPAVLSAQQDLMFQPDDLAVTDFRSSCQMAVSPVKGNAVWAEIINNNTMHLWIKDRVNGYNYKYSTPATAYYLEVSDKGPSGFVNIAYLVGNSNQVMFSKDSGQTFSSLVLEGVGAYSQLPAGALGTNRSYSSPFKFDMQGRLYVFYYTKKTTANEFNFNLSIFDVQGQRIGPVYVLSGSDPIINFFPNYINLTYTDSHMVAHVRPYSWYDNATLSWTQDAAGLFAFDMSTQQLTQKAAIGYHPSHPEFSSAKQEVVDSSSITSDGTSVFLINRTADVGGEYNADIRTFAPLGNGKWFPENYGPGTAFTDLSQIPASVRTSEFTTQEAGSNPHLVHFVAPRLNKKRNMVDVVYYNGKTTSGDMFYGFPVIRLYADRAFAGQGARTRKLNDVDGPLVVQSMPRTTTTYSASGFSTDLQNLGSSYVSIVNGVVVSYCQGVGNESAGNYIHTYQKW